MNGKHFKLIAVAISLATDSAEKDYVHKDQLTSQLIVLFKKENPEFDGFQFLKDCK